MPSRTTPPGGDQRGGPSRLDRSRRRRQILVLVVVGALVLSSAGAILAAVLGGDPEPDQPADPAIEGADAENQGPAALTLPAAGAAVDGTTPCPEQDGSTQRTTAFDGPPPVCIATTEDGAIDTEVDYVATVETNVGELTFLLTTAHAPETTNNFVVLARYGYFDGAPFDVATPLGFAAAGGRFSDTDAEGPGYELASEAPPGGMVSTPGMLAVEPTLDGESSGGRLLVALGENAADLPVETTFFGLLLDGTEAQQALHRAASNSGAPTDEVVIERITVEPSR